MKESVMFGYKYNVKLTHYRLRKAHWSVDGWGSQNF